VVSFRNITAECDGADCTHDITWAAKVMDANCNMQAHVDDYPSKLAHTRLIWRKLVLVCTRARPSPARISSASFKPAISASRLAFFSS